MLIAWGTPYGGDVNPEHYRCKQRVQANCLQHQFISAEVDLMIVSKARNSILQTLPPNIEALWYVDSDVKLPPDAGRMIDYLQDHPLVSGLYVSRRAPYTPQVYAKANADPHSFAYLPVVQLPDCPTHVDAVGAGCLLIRRDLLGDLRREWEAWKERVETWWTQFLAQQEYDQTVRDIEHAVRLGTLLQPEFEFLERAGEDFWFCAMVQYFLDIKPLLVPDIECKHTGQVDFGREHFEAMLGQSPIHYAENGSQILV